MENQLSSSGIFSQDFRHLEFFRRFRAICEAGILNLRILGVEWSPCPCSTTPIGAREAVKNKCFSNSVEVRDYAKRCSQDHWTFFGLGDEAKWYGNRAYKPEGTWNSVATQMLQRFWRDKTSNFVQLSVPCVVDFETDQRKGNHTFHSGCCEHWTSISNHSLCKNQLSFDGGANLGKFMTSEESANTETLKSVISREKSSLVDSSRSGRASGNRMWDDLQDFESLPESNQIATINPVEIGSHYKTHPDMDDGFGGFTPSCREYSLPRRWMEIHSFCCNSSRNCDWTSGKFIVVKIKWTYRIWNWKSFSESFRTNFVSHAVPRNESQSGRITDYKDGVQQYQYGIDHRTSSRRERTLY